jgi:hypothetical protein
MYAYLDVKIFCIFVMYSNFLIWRDKMKIFALLAPFCLVSISCVTDQGGNGIVKFLAVNKLVVAINEKSAVGEQVHFYRLECKSSVTRKRSRCFEVPIADGVVKELVGPNQYRVDLDPGSRIEAFAIVRKHTDNDHYQ